MIQPQIMNPSLMAPMGQQMHRIFEENKFQSFEEPKNQMNSQFPYQDKHPQQQPIQPIFVQQLTPAQLANLQQLNYLKEEVPCIEYLYGFCLDGAKDCIFHHPKPKFK